MFETLMASAAVRDRTASTSVLSAGFHVVLIVGAFAATRSPATAEPAQPSRVYLERFFAAPVSPRGPAVTADTPNARPVGSAALPPAVLTFPLNPLAIAPGLAEGQQRQFVWAPDHDPFTPESPPLYPVPGDSLYVEAMVDEPVRRLSGPAPEYPVALRASGVEGMVALRMVVDTSGRIEPGSIMVQRATHPAFEAAAMAALTQSRFVPARLRGQPVRQLVQQSVRFRLERP
jgi:TonB family protein